MIEITHPAEQRGVVVHRHGGFARDPSQQLAVWYLHELLEVGELLRRQLCNRGIGKAAHDQIHFPHSAMPGTEQKLAPTDIQSFARTCRAGHRFLIACLRAAISAPSRHSPHAVIRAGSATRATSLDADCRASRPPGDADIARRKPNVRSRDWFRLAWFCWVG